MAVGRVRPRIRLWVVSLALFVGGFAARVVANAKVDDVGSTYPAVVSLQGLAYMAGFAFWVAWLEWQAGPGRTMPGCLVGVALAVFSFLALLSSIPK
jgi:hypothetical protein